jgi:peptidoglycan/LPS O-acetylase OafA/YrhL
MLIFGTFFGAIMFYFGSCGEFPMIDETPWWLVLLVMLWCFTLIPLPNTMDIRGWAETNPLNGPAWTLQWEYIANILYALVFRRLSKVALGICVAFFAVMTIILCLNIDVTGFLEARSWASYTVVGGWSTTPDQLQVGLTRLLYPFFCGLLVSRLIIDRSPLTIDRSPLTIDRSPLTIDRSSSAQPMVNGQRSMFNVQRSMFNGQCSMFNVKHGFWWCSLLIVVLLCMPWMGLGTEGEARWTNGLYEAVCILVCFPLIVAMGACSSVTGAKSSAINRFLGEISYPIYITHYPLIYMQMSWVNSHKDAPLGMHIFVAVCIFVLAILVAYGAYRLYDLPLREWLKHKLFQSAAK